MKDWITILAFTYPHEAHLAKGKLESEGIEVQIADEMTVQVNNFYSNAIGGVKLLVREADFHRANQILTDSGYIKPGKQDENKFLKWFDKFSAKFPLIGKTILEIRLMASITTILILIATPIVLFSIPTKLEKLTGNSWCVERIYYNGEELTPDSDGLKMESYYANCSETMSFRENGIVTFPGIGSNGERCNWEFKNDSLIITEWKSVNITKPSDNLDYFVANEKVEEPIFHGVYGLEIKNNVIKMQSENLTIIGKVYRFNYSF